MVFTIHLEFLKTNFAQATLAVDFDVGFAIKEKVSLLSDHQVQGVFLLVPP